MNDLRENLGLVVRKYRKEMGLTQPELASRVGLSPNYLNRLEKGKVNISVDNLNKIVFALGLPPISFGEKNTFNHNSTKIINDITTQLKSLSINDLQSIHRIVSLLGSSNNCNPNQ